LQAASEDMVHVTQETWPVGLVEADVAHLLARLDAAEIQPDPFDHIIVPDFLPVDLFEEIRDLIGGIEAETGRGSVVLTDFQIPARFSMTASRRLRAALTDERVLSLLLRLLEPALRPLMEDGRQPGGWASIRPERLFPRVELMRDRRMMVLPPHTDHHGRLMAALIYCPEPGQREDLGTRLYRPKDPEMRCNGGRSHDYVLFEEAGRAPFTANTLCLFPRTDRSFHGFPMILEEVDRRAVQWSLMRDGHL